MRDLESNPGFFQNVVGRLAALTSRQADAESSSTSGTIAVSLMTLEDRILYSAVPLPIDLAVQVDALDASIDDASVTLFEPAEPLLDFLVPNADFVPAELALDGVSGSIDQQQDWQSDHSTEGVDDGSSLDVDFSDIRFSDIEFSDFDFLQVDVLDVDQAILAHEAGRAAVTRELVVVDRGVEGYQQLVDDLVSSETHDRVFEIIYLDTGTSGIETLSNELSNRVADGVEPYDALHLISHGSDGTVQLGSDRLGANNLDQFGESIAGWGDALSVDADVLIYGCDVAQTESGKDFIDSLASLTGADVAASDDITGHQSLGGDWDFEYIVGTTESDIAFSQFVQQDWEQSLVSHTYDAESGGQAQSIGVDSAGRSTVVASTEADGITDGRDVYLFTKNQFGVHLDNLLVNETLAGDQVHASIAVAENGSKAVTWTSVSTTGERAVFAKFYDGVNSVVRGEFRVDIPSPGVEGDDSSIAVDDAGNVVIVWESTDSGVSEILGRRYSVDGSPVGSVFNVSGSGFDSFEQSANPFVAMNGSGQFVVAWDTHDGSASDESAIFARTFNADGTAFSSPERIQGQANFQYTQASADIDSSGNFVVAYTVNDLAGGTDLDVRAESLSFDGSFVEAHTDFVQVTAGDQYASSVALLDNGNVRIAWEGEGFSPDGLYDSQEVYWATVDFSTGDLLTSQAALDTIEIDDAFVDRFDVSVTTVSDDSFAAAFVRDLLGDDIVMVTGAPGPNNNETPAGSDRTLTLPEDGTLAISASDFGFSDIDGGAFTQVQLSRIPQHGRLYFGGTEVTTGQVILAAELTSDNLLYVPEQDYSGPDDLLFFVQDGTAYSDSFSTLTFDVQPVIDGLLSSFGDTYTPSSGAIPVNTSILGEQNRPQISALDDGGYVVVWESEDTDLTGDSDGKGNNDDGQQIYLQRFDASNNKIGTEVLVGGSLEGDQTSPSVITLADGTYVVAATTTNDSGEVDVYAQRFDLSGNVLLADGSVDVTGNATIALAQHSVSTQDYVSLTALRDGGFLAAWSTLDTTLEADASFATVARIFDADGNPSDEFLLNNADVDPDSSGQFFPQATELNDGSFVTTWYDNRLDRVMYRVFDSSGEPQAESQPVSETAGNPEFSPRIASLGDNGFVIVWTDGDPATEGSEIFARRFNLDGTPAADPAQVLSQDGSTFHALPEVISLNDGGFVVVWNSIGSDNHSIGVTGIRYDADLNPTTDAFVINSRNYGAQGAPSLAMLSDGELVVTYTSSDGDNNGSTYGNGIFVDRLAPGAFTDEDTPVPLNLVFSNIDADGSEFADDIQLSGMPAGTQVSDGVTTVEVTGFSDVVHVTRDGLQIENLTLTPPENFYGDISTGVTFVVRDTDGTATVSGAYETRMMTIRVNPVNDVATYDPIATTVDENGTTDIDVGSFLSPANDPDNAEIYPSATPVAGYDLSAADPIVASAGTLQWNSSVGAPGTISFDAADAQFNANPTTDYQGIQAALDLNGSGGGDLSIDGAKALEIWFRPDADNAQQTLVEFGDADSGWGLYLLNGQIQLHFRSADAPINVTPQVLTGGQLSSSEFNQVVVAFSTDGDLAGDSTQPDVSLYVNGERVDLLTDIQGLGDLSLLTGNLNGAIGATEGGFVHANAAAYDNFTGSIAQVNAYDESFTPDQVQNRFFEVTHGAHVVQVDGNDVEVGVATELSSGALVTYSADGTITYDPNGQFEQLDAFNLSNSDSYQRDDFEISVSDGQGDTQTLTVQLTVEGENDAPTLSFSLADPAPTTVSTAGTLVAIAEGADIDTNGESGLTYSLTGTVTGAFVIDANSGEITINDLGVYQNPPSGNHEVTVTVTDLAGATSEVSYTIPVVNIPTGQVTGTVYEDIVGDGSIAGDSGVDGVTVHLYRDNGDGVRDANDIHVATTLTTGGGNYVFQGPALTYDDYFVVVDSTDITSSNGFNSSYDVNDVWAEQTYASAGGLFLDGAGVETVSGGGALFGGYSGTRSDDASTLAGAEHVSQVTVSNSIDGIADFGFSFNVVTNTLAGDDQDDDAGSARRTVQGSLRQFIDNANAIDNSDPSDVDNAMRFVARNEANSADSTWWSIVVSEALPAILDSNTTIDGTVYAADGSGVLDLRTDRSGTVTTVGANDSHALNGFDQPELEIVADQTVADDDRVMNGLVFAASADQTTLRDIAVRNLSIHGFGSTTGSGINISLAGGGIDGSSDYSIENALIENTFIGVAPDGSNETVLRSHGIRVYRANDGVVQDSLIGNQGLAGISFRSNASDNGAIIATGWQILRNEVSNNGSFSGEHGGLSLGNSSGTLVRHNLIADNVGFGIDTFFAAGNFDILENTITRTSSILFDQGGIRLFGNDSVVSQNRIVDNAGAGVSVVGTTQQRSYFAFAGTGNELTQNQFGGNAGIDIDLLESLTGGQSFADLTVDGTAVTGLDTDGDGSLSAAEIVGTGLTLADDDADRSGSISNNEYDTAQRRQTGQGDGVSAVDGFNQHSGNQGLDQPELVTASLFPDRVELEFSIASGVERVELYDVTVVGPDERVNYVTTLLVSEMTFDASSGTYRATVDPSLPVAGQLTAVAFEGANTSEFGNRVNLNSVPTGQSNTITTLEDTPKSLEQADFGFADVEDQSDVSKGLINISSVTGGTLQLSGTDVVLPASLSRGDLDNLVLTPTPDSTSDGVIAFTVTDSDGDSDGATYQLTVLVTEVNDAPELDIAITNFTIEENTPFELTPIVADTEDGTARWEIVPDTNLGVFVNDGGTLRFTALPDYENLLSEHGDNQFNVAIVGVDSEGLESEEQLINVTITDVNEAPVATSDPVFASVEVSTDPSDIQINVNDLVSDVDAGDSLTFSVLNQADQGFVTIDENGDVFFELTDPAGSGQDSFEFIATDAGGLQSEIVTVDLDVLNDIVIPNNENTDRDEENDGDDTDSNSGLDDSANVNQSGDPTASSGLGRNVDEDNPLTDDLISLVSDGVVSSSENPIGFNDFDDEETTLIESDSLSSGAARTYSYAFNLEEIDLLNKLSDDHNTRHSAHAIEFDASVLASAFLDELDSSKQHFIRDRLAIGSPEVAVSAASLLTVGYFLWNMGSGLLLSTFMSSLPAWSSFDVLPVISGAAIDDEDEESIEQIVDA